jgi:hypothetical protein
VAFLDEISQVNTSCYNTNHASCKEGCTHGLRAGHRGRSSHCRISCSHLSWLASSSRLLRSSSSSSSVHGAFRRALQLAPATPPASSSSSSLAGRGQHSLVIYVPMMITPRSLCLSAVRQTLEKYTVHIHCTFAGHKAAQHSHVPFMGITEYSLLGNSPVPPVPVPVPPAATPTATGPTASMPAAILPRVRSRVGRLGSSSRVGSGRVRCSGLGICTCSSKRHRQHGLCGNCKLVVACKHQQT